MKWIINYFRKFFFVFLFKLIWSFGNVVRSSRRVARCAKMATPKQKEKLNKEKSKKAVSPGSIIYEICIVSLDWIQSMVSANNFNSQHKQRDVSVGCYIVTHSNTTRWNKRVVWYDYEITSSIICDNLQLCWKHNKECNHVSLILGNIMIFKWKVFSRHGRRFQNGGKKSILFRL